jgi:hypothetical protein
MARILQGKTEVTQAHETLVRVMNEWHEAHRQYFVNSGYTNLLPTFDTQEEKHGHIGKTYTRLDVGGSGAWMLELATGDVYGIKGYGKIDRKKCAGNIFHPNFSGAVLFHDRFRRGPFDNRKRV